MSVWHIIIVSAYAVVGSLHIVGLFLPQNDRILRGSRFATLGLAALHLCAIGSSCLRGFHPLQDAAGVLQLVAFALTLGYAVTSFKFRLFAVGGFVIPLAFALVLSAQLTQRPDAPAQLGSVLGRLHLALVALGVASFALAAAVATVYLVQDRALRTRRLGALYGKTPALTTLETLTMRLSLFGFPFFTLAVATGIWWMKQLGRPGFFRIEYLISGGIWMIFAAIIGLRLTVGLRGRKAAALTIVGFGAAALVLLIYVGRKVMVG